MKKLFLIAIFALAVICINGQDPPRLLSVGNAYNGRNVGRINATIERTNDLSLVPYAAIAFSDSAYSPSADSGTWETITNATNSLFVTSASSDITVDGDTMVMEYAGGYDVRSTLSVLLDTISIYEFALFKSNSVIFSPKVEFKADSGEIATATLDWHFTVAAAGETYQLKVRNMSNSNDPTFINCSWVTIRRYWDRD